MMRKNPYQSPTATDQRSRLPWRILWRSLALVIAGAACGLFDELVIHERAYGTVSPPILWDNLHILLHWFAVLSLALGLPILVGACFILTLLAGKRTITALYADGSDID